MEGGVGLIVIGTLFQVVELNLGRRYVAVVDTNLAVLLLIIDVEVVENGLHLYAGRIGERLVTIQTIFIDGNIAIECQLKDIGEEVHLPVHRLHRIVESAIGITVEVYLAIDVTTPHHVLGHIDSRWELQTGTHGHTLILLRLLTLLLLLLSLLLLPTRLRLRTHSTSHQRYHQ